MKRFHLTTSAGLAFLACCTATFAAAQTIQVNKENRTIAITATDKVVSQADSASVHIGFIAYGPDSDTAYATGSRISNAIHKSLITAGIALAATIFVIGTVQPSYTAKSTVALIPGKQLPAADVASYWEALGGGQAGRVAAEVFQQDQWKDAAAAAAGVSPESITVTSGVIESSALINVTVETTSPQGAEAALDKIILDATPLVQRVSGPYDLTVVQAAAGSAQASNVSASQLLIVVFVGGLLVGSGAALIIARARTRSKEEPEFYDTGEFRAQSGSGYNRPVGPPPGRGPQGGPPPNGSNGAYGPPPRRPAGDPRAQPPR